MRMVWGAIGVGAVLALGAAGISRVASDRAAALHAEAVRALGANESVTVLDEWFERGWTDSRAEIHVEVAGPLGAWLRDQLEHAGIEHARTRYGLKLESDLAHGPDQFWQWLLGPSDGEPLVAVAVSTLQLDHESARDFEETLGAVPPVSFVTEIRISGAHRTSVVWDAASFQRSDDAEPWRVAWGGLDGLVQRAPDGTVEGHLAGEGLRFETAAGSLRAAGADVDFRGRVDAGGNWSGTLGQRWRNVAWSPAPTAPAGAAMPAAATPDRGTPTMDDAEPSGSRDRWVAAEVRARQTVPGPAEGDDVRTVAFSAEGQGVQVADAAVETLRLEGTLAFESSRAREMAAAASDGTSDAQPRADVPWLLAPLLAHRPSLAGLRLEVRGPSGGIGIAGDLWLAPPPAAEAGLWTPRDAVEGELRVESRGRLGARLGLGPERFAAWAAAGLAEAPAMPAEPAPVAAGAAAKSPVDEEPAELAAAVRRAHFILAGGRLLPPLPAADADDALAPGSVPAAQADAAPLPVAPTDPR